MTEEEHAKNLLKKYADDNITSPDRKKVDEWYDALDESPMRISDRNKASINEQMYSALQQAMARTDRKRVIRLIPMLRMTGIAAAIMIIITAVFLTRLQPGKIPAVKRLFAVATKAGETKRIKLPDGSEILLNPLSRITYAPDFNVSNRTVELSEGEAFFEIAHDETHPFLVNTEEGISTKVLGTSFRIKSYHARRKVDVIVATGKVEIGNTQQVFATLIRGQQLSYDKNLHRAEVTYTPSPAAVELKFDNVTLQEAMRQMEYAYSIRIILDPSLEGLKCEATFTTKQEPAEILEILCSLHHLRFKASQDLKTFKIDKI